MSAETACAYGLVDKVLQSKKDLAVVPQTV
jgi:ATP-dependent protease ClpP protease subunit